MTTPSTPNNSSGTEPPKKKNKKEYNNVFHHYFALSREITRSDANQVLAYISNFMPAEYRDVKDTDSGICFSSKNKYIQVCRSNDMGVYSKLFANKDRTKYALSTIAMAFESRAPFISGRNKICLRFCTTDPECKFTKGEERLILIAFIKIFNLLPFPSVFDKCFN